MSTSNDSPAGGDIDRRRFFTIAAATGGAAALGLLGTSTAQAITQSGLPPIGAEIPCSMLAVNTPLRIRGEFMTVDFRGGIKHRVEVNPDDPQYSVRLRTIGFRMSAELPDDGTLTLEQNDIDVYAKSVLRLTQKFPPRYQLSLELGFTMTIDQPDDLGRIHEPLVLTTKDPAQLVGQLTQFPPRGDLYRLQNPVDLILPDEPDSTIATIQRFPVRVGGL